MSDKPVICWFRQDLRLSDNPALSAAASRGQVLPIYVLDDEQAGEFAMGGASRWWLHQSLLSLDQQLGGRLRLYRGDAAEIVPALCRELGVEAVLWNRCYEPWRITRDEVIKLELQGAGVDVESFNGSLLLEPWNTVKDDGDPYRVFTPFYRKSYGSPHFGEPLATPQSLVLWDGEAGALSLDKLSLLPSRNWYQGMADTWQVGESAAGDRLGTFLSDAIADYRHGRDYPAAECVSRLSPYLHWGQISPRQILQRTLEVPDTDGLEHFRREIGWREFSYALLYYYRELPTRPLQPRFERFPWGRDATLLAAWQQGKTGYPVVDAGMRELWQTGYMHNRVRMVVASFLVKNLQLHWHLGRDWFWDCLVDADLASNSASWQWVSGCGADAAPYFRVFNPVTQGERFDPAGDYTRKFVPELAQLPDKWLHKPWQAPADVLSQAGVALGEVYPEPIVELKQSREAALEAYKGLP